VKVTLSAPPHTSDSIYLLHFSQTRYAEVLVEHRERHNAATYGVSIMAAPSKYRLHLPTLNIFIMVSMARLSTAQVYGLETKASLCLPWFDTDGIMILFWNVWVYGYLGIWVSGKKCKY
jgi:hypothetical protein